MLGKLFGSQKVVDGLMSAGDKVFYTDEEKADNFRHLLKLYEPFKIAQRLLMLIMCVPYMAAWLATFIASFWIDIGMQQELLMGKVGTLVIVIVGFYFGGGAVEGIMKAKGNP